MALPSPGSNPGWDCGPLLSGPCYFGATFHRETVFNFRKKENYPFPAKQAPLIRYCSSFDYQVFQDQ